jgi:hypothetical protein
MDEFTSMLERATERAPDGLEASVASALRRERGSDRHRAGGGGRRRGRILLLAAALVVVVVVAGAIALAVRNDHGLDVTTDGRGPGPVTTTIPEPTTDVVARFCAVANDLSGERPESYVGSPAHVRDVTRLTERAPITIRSSAEKYRKFLASGAVDPADPDSNLQSNWPGFVRAAVQDLARYIAAACPGASRPIPDAPHPHAGQSVLADGHTHGTPWWSIAWPSADDLRVKKHPGKPETTLVHRTGYCIGVNDPSGGSGVCMYGYRNHPMTTSFGFGHAGRQDFVEGSATEDVSEIRVVLRTGAVRAATPQPIRGTTLRGWVIPLPTEGPVAGKEGSLRPVEAIRQIVAVRPGVDQVLFP